MLIPFRAKAILNKKAKLNKPANDNTATEPEKTPEPVETNADAMLDDPPPQEHDFLAEQVEVDATGHADTLTSPARTNDKPASPVRAIDKPPSPLKAAEDNTDDIMVTGFGHTTPGNPIALSKHSANKEFAAMDNGKWKTDLSSYAHLNAQDIHSGFLNHMYTSRDYEACLENMMKERYVVNAINSA